MKIYALKDVKSAEFINVFVQKNDLMMKRLLITMASNPSYGLLNSCPQDFELYSLGEFNVENGNISNCNSEFICNVLEVMQNELNPQKS